MQVLEGIHATNDYERRLFGAVKERFSDNLYRWYSDVRPDHYNSNFFTPISDLTRKDILAVVAFQKKQQLRETMIRTTKAVNPRLMAGFRHTEYIAHVMAMLTDQSHLWKNNNGIEIRDIQTHDISRDILDVSDVPEQHKDVVYRNMKMVLEVDKDHPEYHWLCAYKGSAPIKTESVLEWHTLWSMTDL